MSFERSIDWFCLFSHFNHLNGNSSPQSKELWHERIQQSINKVKEKEGKSNTTIQISYWDQTANEEKYTLVKVTNRATTVDVIKSAIQEFKCEGDLSDYQLWVKTSRDDTPYPLIGHEYPFAIKMNFVRDLLHRSNLDLQNFNNIAADNKCIFILRKSCPKTSLLENSKKHKKPRKPINWPFKKIVVKADISIDSGISSEPSTPTKAILFGQHLDLLCNGQTLPKPILGMLKELFLKGPYTVGIFRKSANARVCKEFRAKLETDPNTDMSEVPVNVIASVFKEFLRSLPDCLLQSSLYPKWIESISIENNLECRERMSLLLQSLPASCLVLLRHFLCALWHISHHSVFNKMCSVNLGVCVGQSLLSPNAFGCPNPIPPTTQRCEEMSKQVPKLIAYLIDHCPDLLGADTLALLGNPPEKDVLRQDSGAEESDSLNSLPDNGVGSNASSNGNRCDDSSIDSLERALLDDNNGSSTSGNTQSSVTFGNKMSLSNLSRDSGLTLSDTQLYNPEDEESESDNFSTYHKSSPLVYPYLTKSVPHLDTAGLDSDINFTFSYGRSVGVSIDGSCHDVVRKRRHQRSSIPKQSMHSSSLRSNPCPPSYQEAMNRKEMICRAQNTVSQYPHQLPLRKTSSASNSSTNSNQIYEESVRIYHEDLHNKSNVTHRAYPVRVKNIDSDNSDFESNEQMRKNSSNLSLHKQVVRAVSEGTPLMNGPRIVRISAHNHPHYHHSHQQPVSVLQRSAKDFTPEEWKKDINCNVANLRKIFTPTQTTQKSKTCENTYNIFIRQSGRPISVLIDNDNKNGLFRQRPTSIQETNSLYNRSFDSCLETQGRANDLVNSQTSGKGITVVHVGQNDTLGKPSIITIHKRSDSVGNSSEEESYV